MTRIAPDILRAILEAAVAAPSAENRHLFRVDVRESEILLCGNQEFETAPVHRQLLTLISFGAVAENMILRAAHYGLSLRVSWSRSTAESLVVGRFFLDPFQPIQDDLEQAIHHRHTNRRPWFRGPPLNAREQTLLVSDARSVPQVDLLWFDDAASRRKALRLVWIAETERFRRAELHKELFEPIRFDIGWHTSVDEGLPSGSLEIEPGLRAMFRQLANWRLMRTLNGIGLHNVIAFRAAYLPCRVAPHLCGFIAPMNDLSAAALAVGRAFERVWLRLTLLGFQVQPFAASALFAFPGCPWISTSLADVLRTGWAELSPTASPLMVFRAGRARAPSVRAGRPRVEALLSQPPPSWGSGNACSSDLTRWGPDLAE